MQTARAFWVTGKATGEIRDVAVAEPGPDDVLVETVYSAISRGTETLVFNGLVPSGQYGRMRAPFQEGQFPSPVKYGYINVGRVIEGPEPLAGRMVFTLYPHQSRFVVPAAAVTVLPDDVPAGRAVLAANLETAVNALWDARPQIGDRIAVIGAGTVGCLVAWLASRVAGTETALIDIDPGKRRIAGELGVPFREPAEAGSDFDAVIHASGNPTGLDTAIGLAGFEATIVELSWYGREPVSVGLGGDFHSQRLTLRSSQVGHVARAQRSRWSRERRMALVMRLLADNALDALIDAESRFDDLPATMAALAGADASALCHRITYL